MRIRLGRAFAGESLLLRVQLEFAAHPQGNDDKVPDARRAVAVSMFAIGSGSELAKKFFLHNIHDDNSVGCHV
jgi:hypothetical protein